MKCKGCERGFNNVKGTGFCESCEGWDQFGLGMAFYCATKSKDPSTKVGAAIFDCDHCVSGIGFNGFPRGIKDDERLDDRKKKYPRVVHAEANAIMNSDGNGITLYCTLFPCSTCAGLIIQHKIERVVTPPISIERWAESQEIAKEMFIEASLKVRTLELLSSLP